MAGSQEQLSLNAALARDHSLLLVRSGTRAPGLAGSCPSSPRARSSVGRARPHTQPRCAARRRSDWQGCLGRAAAAPPVSRAARPPLAARDLHPPCVARLLPCG